MLVKPERNQIKNIMNVFQFPNDKLLYRINFNNLVHDACIKFFTYRNQYRPVIIISIDKQKRSVKVSSVSFYKGFESLTSPMTEALQGLVSQLNKVLN